MYLFITFFYLNKSILLQYKVKMDANDHHEIDLFTPAIDIDNLMRLMKAKRPILSSATCVNIRSISGLTINVNNNLNMLIAIPIEMHYV